MQVEWKKQATRQLEAIIAYGENNFGKQAAARFYSKVKACDARLADNPELGFPEPLLAERKRNYRSLIVDEHYKIIYWTDTAQGIIYIADLWNSCGTDAVRCSFESQPGCEAE